MRSQKRNDIKAFRPLYVWKRMPMIDDLPVKKKKVFGYFKGIDIAIPNLSKVVECACCLPGTLAPVERFFLLMNNVWSDDCGIMRESTVNALMACKIIIGLSCEDFYKKTNNNEF